MEKLYTTIAAVGGAVAITLCLAGSPATPVGAQIGQPVPQFALQNMDGSNVALNSYNGKIVVLEWTNPQCPFVQQAYKEREMVDVAAKYKSSGVEWIAINSTHDMSNAEDKQWAAQQGINYPILNDASGTTGHAYGATNTPEMYVVGKDGKLLYKGAIDNDRDDNLTSGKINYVDQALNETLAGKPVSVPETAPYGCTVHYAD
jgi:peroxiredoxin